MLSCLALTAGKKHFSLNGKNNVAAGTEQTATKPRRLTTYAENTPFKNPQLLQCHINMLQSTSC